MRGVCNMLHVPGRLDARRGDRRSDRDTRVGACDLRYGYGGPVGRASVATRPARAVAVSHTATRSVRFWGFTSHLRVRPRGENSPFARCTATS